MALPTRLAHTEEEQKRLVNECPPPFLQRKPAFPFVSAGKVVSYGAESGCNDRTNSVRRCCKDFLRFRNIHMACNLLSHARLTRGKEARQLHLEERVQVLPLRAPLTRICWTRLAASNAQRQGDWHCAPQMWLMMSTHLLKPSSCYRCLVHPADQGPQRSSETPLRRYHQVAKLTLPECCSAQETAKTKKRLNT